MRARAPFLRAQFRTQKIDYLFVFANLCTSWAPASSPLPLAVSLFVSAPLPSRAGARHRSRAFQVLWQEDDFPRRQVRVPRAEGVRRVAGGWPTVTCAVCRLWPRFTTIYVNIFILYSLNCPRGCSLSSTPDLGPVKIWLPVSSPCLRLAWEVSASSERYFMLSIMKHRSSVFRVDAEWPST